MRSSRSGIRISLRLWRRHLIRPENAVGISLGIELCPEVMPGIGRAAIMEALESERTIAHYEHGRIRSFMAMIKRAFAEDVFGAFTAADLLGNFDMVFSQKRIHIKRRITLAGRRGSSLDHLFTLSGNRANQCHGRRLKSLRNVQDRALTVRTLGRVCTFPGDSSVQFGDPGRIEYGCINQHLVRGKPKIQNFQEIGNGVFAGQFSLNLVQQVVTVTAVSNDRFREADLLQVLVYIAGSLVRQFLFLVRRADSGRADRICVDQNPAITDDVLVGRGFLRIGPQDFALAAGIAGRINRVERLVKRAIREFRQFRGEIQAAGLEIAADRGLGIDTADLYDVVRGVQQRQAVQYSVHALLASISS